MYEQGLDLTEMDYLKQGSLVKSKGGWRSDHNRFLKFEVKWVVGDQWDIGPEDRSVPLAEEMSVLGQAHSITRCSVHVPLYVYIHIWGYIEEWIQ